MSRASRHFDTIRAYRRWRFWLWGVWGRRFFKTYWDVDFVNQDLINPRTRFKTARDWRLDRELEMCCCHPQKKRSECRGPHEFGKVM